MEITVRILGEHEESRPARAMIGPALEHSAAFLGITIHYDWRRSKEIDLTELEGIHGMFIAPGSPKEENRQIIEAIKLAREEGIPCIGTCGGFQRIVAEYALNELSYEKIEHRETEPNSSDPLFAELSCSLAGKDSNVFILPGTMASSIYEKVKVTERFFCQYGLSKSHIKKIESKDLKISATGKNGEPRFIEHVSHPFFVGTLFVPQVQSETGVPHPIITAFVKKSKEKQNNQALQATSASARRLS